MAKSTDVAKAADIVETAPLPSQGGVYHRDPQSGELSRVNEAEGQDEQA